MKNTDLCFVKLLKVVKDPHLDLEPLPDERHLVGAVLGSQVFLALLLVLGAAPVEVDLILVALVPCPRVCVLDWLRLLDWLGQGHRHWLAVVGLGLVGLTHLHLDQRTFLERKRKLKVNPLKKTEI